MKKAFHVYRCGTFGHDHVIVSIEGLPVYMAETFQEAWDQTFGSDLSAFHPLRGKHQPTMSDIEEGNVPIDAFLDQILGTEQTS